jgi:hypothetical protein
MVVLRCTRPLLRDVRRHHVVAETAVSTTHLGDWFANRLNVGHRRYILATNALTRLSVVVPARDLGQLPNRITAALDTLLTHIGVPARERTREMDLMQDVSIAPTNSASVLSTMTDIAFSAYDELYDLPFRPGRTLAHVDLTLSALPLRFAGYRTTAELARERLMRAGRFVPHPDRSS